MVSQPIRTILVLVFSSFIQIVRKEMNDVLVKRIVLLFVLGSFVLTVTNQTKIDE